MADEAQNPYFRFKVTELGRIAEADIELRPLTLLVGENNSGKSYLATLIWAVHQVPMRVFSRLDLVEWQQARRWLEENVPENPLRSDAWVERAIEHSQGLEYPEDVVRLGQEFTTLADRLLMEALPSHLAQAFRTRLQELSVQISSRYSRARIARTSKEDWLLVNPDRWKAKGAFSDRSIVELALAASCSAPGDNLSLEITGPSRFLFFPASRSGYLQLLPDVLDRLLGGVLEPEERSLRDVTAPVIQFLRFLNEAKTERNESERARLAVRIEQEVLHGELSRDDGPGGWFRFQPMNTAIFLPMGRVSAVVSELLPLITLLRTRHRPRLLIYEEPEAHLHPRYQRLVARVLVRLVRSGTTVVVTTHSATMAQQFNNALTLATIPAERRASLPAPHGFEPYSDEDVLRPEDVAAYGFRFREDGRTAVDRLAVSERGVIMPSFNDELMDLREEMARLVDAAEQD